MGDRNADNGTSVEQDHLLWIDLETTGSDEDHDCIIEVGAVLTTEALDVLGEFSMTVTPTPEGLGRMMLNPTVREMHEGNGLLAEILGADKVRKPHHVTKALLAWVEGLGGKRGRTVLAGSGVAHFDRRFIARYMPELDRFMRYWCIDIGVVRRAYRMWNGGDVSSANDGKTHRALDDVRCHVAEAQAYRSLWSQPDRTGDT